MTTVKDELAQKSGALDQCYIPATWWPSKPCARCANNGIRAVLVIDDDAHLWSVCHEPGRLKNKSAAARARCEAGLRWAK